MDIHETYKHFQHEQVDAFDPTRRTRFDAFGEVRMEPDVEGFTTWGLNPHAREEAKKRARREDVEHAHASALRREANEHARREANRVMRLRQGLKV